MMGDGAKLKQILKEKNTNVRKLAMAIGVSPTTLYSIVQKDSKLRLELAMLIANELDVNVEDICSSVRVLLPRQVKISEAYQESEDNLMTHFHKCNIERMLEMFGDDQLSMVTDLLRQYYALDDVARHDLLLFLKSMQVNHCDKSRYKNLEDMKLVVFNI